MKLDYLQALKRIPQARGLWVLHGAEPLLEQNLLDRFRAAWLDEEVERQRYDIQSVSDWKTVFNALNSLSLFSNKLAIEVHGTIKPDAQAIKQLKQYLLQDAGNLLLVVLPKQDSNSLKSSFFQLVEANGVLVNLNINYPKDRQQILEDEARKLGIELEADAWQWLMQHHEHNLLAAKNSLLRIRDTYPERSLIQAQQLRESMTDQSRYSNYDLTDALLKGSLEQSVKIWRYLKASGEPHSLILWALSKEMRLLMQLFEQPQNALQLGIWKTRVALYQAALRRISATQFLYWPSLLVKIDAAIKGMSRENPDHLILQAIAELCAKPLFTPEPFVK